MRLIENIAAASEFEYGGAPASYKEALIGQKEWKKAFNAEIVGVRTESIGADMTTKAVGPSMLSVNMKLLGMFKCG